MKVTEVCSKARASKEQKKVEAIVALGSQMSTTAIACVDVLFSENWPTVTRQELLASKSLMKKRCDFCHQSCAISLIRPHLRNNRIMFVQK